MELPALLPANVRRSAFPHLVLGFVLLFAPPSGAQDSGSASIPNVMVSAGNLLRDCRPEIDMAAEQGFTALGAEFALDYVYGGWGFHYLLDFTDFPEARVFPAETIERNREQVRANLAYAAGKGVRVYLHHYNFCAPRPFVEAHPEVNRRPKPTVMDEKTGHVYGDLCWNAPLYRRFLTGCWEELFRTYPELGGLVVTFGECNHCPDEDKGEQWVETARSFFTTYNEVLRRHGKLPVARTWWMRRLHVKWRTGEDTLAHTFLPRGPVYLMKFSLYDTVTEEPDEEFGAWREAGLDLWADLMARGENVGPFHYINPRFQHARIGSLVRRKVQGLKIIANDPGGASSPLFRLNQAALLRYARRFEAYDEGEWVRRVAEVVGEAEALPVLRACEDASAVILGLPRVLGLPDEGFNVMGFYYFPPYAGWPGTLGAENMNPAPEWRRGLVPFREIIQACAREGSPRRAVEVVCAGRPSPFETIEGYVQRCEGGIRSLEASEKRLLDAGRKEAAGHVAQVLLRARASAFWGSYWQQMLRARLDYEGALRALTDDERRACARDCREHYDQGVALLERTVSLLNERGNVAQGLRMRREHRQRILDTVERAVTDPPKRPQPITVGAQVLTNGDFEQDDDRDGVPDGWRTIPYAGKPRFERAPGSAGQGAAVAGDDPGARGAWTQLPEGAFGEGKYRLRARYRLQAVEAEEEGAVIRVIARGESRRDLNQQRIALGRGTSEGWHVVERDLVFPPEAVSLEVNLFLWLATGRVLFDDVTLTRIE